MTYRQFQTGGFFCFMSRLVWTTLVSFGLSLSLAASAEAETKLKSMYKMPDVIPFPADNPYTSEKAALGKALFFDPRLSGDQNMTCASCHNPSFGWEVSTKTSVGALSTKLKRQAPTILNLAWRAPFFWDGRSMSAEDQALVPIENPAEMNLPIAVAVERLNAIKGYKAWFAKVFPQRKIAPTTIAAALATYERTIVSNYSPFDQWIDGDEKAISQSAKDGFDLFVGRARCAACHTGWNFTDNKFHDIGTTDDDIGRAAVAPNEPVSKFACKTPSLRDIAKRAPYMHAGQIETLRDVVIHYMGGGIDRPSRSPLFEPVDLSDDDINNMVAFLESLTGARQTVPLPVLPR
ncbi:MAG: cytochrome c peroxidase [Pseudomonadota bacterium]